MRKLTFPFRLPLREIKKDNAFRKTIQNKVIKTTMIGIMRQSCMFFFIMLIMYTYLAYLAIITVSLLEPVIRLIVFLAFLFMLWVFVTIFKNIFPKSKKNFLEYNNVYEKYLEVTKDIE